MENESIYRISFLQTIFVFLLSDPALLAKYVYVIKVCFYEIISKKCSRACPKAKLQHKGQ